MMMLWLRYTATCAVVAALGGGTGADAAHLGWFGKRQPEGQGLTRATPTEKNHASSVRGLFAREETPSASGSADDNAPVCNKDKISVAPFCLPEDGQEVHVGEQYYVTWEPSAFPHNSTIVVGLSYENNTDGKSPYVSDKMPNFGFTSITMEESWLQEEKSNNLTVYIADNGASSEDKDNKDHFKLGPKVTLTHKPTKHYPPPPHTTYSKLGLMIGLPIGLVVFFLLLVGLCVGMRKKRRIGLGNIMGLRNKSHFGGQSRIDRLGGHSTRRRARSGAAIRLANMEEGEPYTDDPQPQQQLPSDTDRFNEVERSQGNVFRHEISRLKTWR